MSDTRSVEPKRRHYKDLTLMRGKIMSARSIGLICVLVLLPTPSLASDPEVEFFLSDLDGFKLSLDGADHYYWLTPEKGRVVLNKQCVPTDEDCDHDVVAVWDEDGKKIFERAPFLDIPDMSHGSIYDSTLIAPNRLIVSTITGEDTFTSVLAEYDVDNQELLRVIPTGSIRCMNVLGDEEGTIWCLGDDVAKRSKDEDYDLVHRFDAAGKPLESSLPRSIYPESPGPLSVIKRIHGYGGFLPGNGQIRLWLPEVEELITFDSEGRVTDRLILPTVEDLIQARLVTAPDDEVYAVLTSGTDPRDSDTWTHALFRLTNDGATWTPLEDPPVHLPIRLTLQGADESGLILLDRRSLQLLWYPISTDSAMTEMADASTMGYDE
jgi:hypothetical protein